MTSVTVPKSLKLFSLPTQNTVVSGNDKNITRFLPKNGSNFNSNSNVVEFQIGTSSDLIDPSSIAFKADFVPSYTGANVITTGLGCSAPFQRMTLEAGGCIIEDINRYNLYTASKYHYETDETRKMRKTFENYTGTSAGSALSSTAGSTFVHHPQLGFFNSPHSKMIPTPYLRGGMKLTAYLAKDSEVILSSTGGNYSLNNVELLCKTKTVSPDFQAAVISKMENGESIQLPYVQVKHQTANGSGSNELDINVNTQGFTSSVRQIWVRQRDNTTITTQASDKFCGNFTASNLESYSLDIEGQMLPQGKPIQYKQNTDPEDLFLNYCEEGKAPVSYTNGDFFLKINLSEQEFASGVSTLNTGNIRLRLTAKAGQTFPITNVFDVFVLYDSVAVVNKSFISVQKRF
jgi:hypothetical protein